jgi:hypothetical protein
MRGRRQPADKDATEPQPHEPDRDRRQQYAREHEDSSGGGVMRPPKQQTGSREGRKPR